MTSDLNVLYGEMSKFATLPMFDFTLVIKLTSFDFESNWNNFFQSKINDIRFEYDLSNNVWFGLSLVVWVKCWQ